MTSRVKLIYPRHLIREPVLFTMAKKYDVITNIRRARVTENIGEMIIELEGDEKKLKDGIQFLKEKGIKVELIIGDIME